MGGEPEGCVWEEWGNRKRGRGKHLAPIYIHREAENICRITGGRSFFPGPGRILILIPYRQIPRTHNQAKISLIPPSGSSHVPTQPRRKIRRFL